jgi:hypothetical protein
LKNILSVNHPVFRRFAKLTKTNYRVYFQTLAEANTWLKVRSYDQVSKDRLDKGSILEWSNGDNKKYIKLTHELFSSDGVLLPMSEEAFDPSWLTIHEYSDDGPPPQPDDDEIPF